MSKLNIVRRDGAKIALEGRSGVSLMEHIRDCGVDELLASCGGCCCCGTCHVYVYPESAGTTPPMSGEESDLLDNSKHRRPNSRLSCQIPFGSELDGLTVAIAPED